MPYNNTMQKTEKEKFKMCISGNYIEIYRYIRLPINNSNKRNKPNNLLLTDPDTYYHNKVENRKRSLSRINKQVRRLFKCNRDLNRFITLTYKNNMQDKRKARKDYNLFLKRLSYYSPKIIKYLGVIEFQQRGAIHFHVAINQYILKKDLEKIWSHGFVKVNYVKDPDHLVNYMSKYFTKNSATDRRLWGERLYFASHNIRRPLKYIYYTWDEVQNKIKDIKKMVGDIKTIKEVLMITCIPFLKELDIYELKIIPNKAEVFH